MDDVIGLIDGFNLYHAVHDLGRPHLKWVDLWALCESLAYDNERIAAVHYFSAFATWKHGPYARHRRYVGALSAKGVNCSMAHFKEKRRRCNSCGTAWLAHEEKESDVRFALQLAEAASDRTYRRALLITGDSDLVPAVKMAKRRHPSGHITLVAPPGRLGGARDLRKVCNSAVQITAGRLAKNLLPASLNGGDGTVIQRPPEYAPPAT